MSTPEDSGLSDRLRQLETDALQERDAIFSQLLWRATEVARIIRHCIGETDPEGTDVEGLLHEEDDLYMRVEAQKKITRDQRESLRRILRPKKPAANQTA